ncbi:MAG TPA: alpha/beta hydrolase [Candidatus Nanopelagicaceae bacterium]
MKTAAFLPEAKISVPVVGGELAVFRYGPEGGKPILAIHGVTSSNRTWQLLAASLVPGDYTLYAVDLRGRGDSNALLGPFGMSTHARDMVAVIDHLGLPKVDQIGHSMGAFVAVALLGLAPERINRTVLVDGGIPLPLPAGFTVAQVLPYVLGPALARLEMTFESREAYRNFWKALPAFVKGWSPVLDEYVDYDLRGIAPKMYASTNKQAVEEDSIDLFGSDLIEKTLRNLTDEVLMLRAVRGLQNEVPPLYPEATLNAALLQYPKIKVVTVPDTNHYDILMEESGAKACASLIYGVH